MTELKPCPFCKNNEVEYRENKICFQSKENISVELIHHHADDKFKITNRPIIMVGKTKEEVIERWNTRIGDKNE